MGIKLLQAIFIKRKIVLKKENTADKKLISSNRKQMTSARDRFFKTFSLMSFVFKSIFFQMHQSQLNKYGLILKEKNHSPQLKYLYVT